MSCLGAARYDDDAANIKPEHDRDDLCEWGVNGAIVALQEVMNTLYAYGLWGTH